MRRRQNPMDLSPDRVLRHASRVLKENPAYMLPFLKDLGIEPALQVNYRDYGGHNQFWAGPPKKWLGHLKKYKHDMQEIVSWDLILGRYLVSSEWGEEYTPRDPYKQSMAWLKRHGWVT